MKPRIVSSVFAGGNKFARTARSTVASINPATPVRLPPSSPRRDVTTATTLSSIRSPRLRLPSPGRSHYYPSSLYGHTSIGPSSPARARTFTTSRTPTLQRQYEYRRFGPPGGGRQQQSPFGFGGGGRGGSGSFLQDNTGKIVIFLAVAGGVYYVVHLEKVPETGRWRFMDTTVEYEKTMGDYTFKQLMQEYRGQILPPNHPTAVYVNSVARRILHVAGLDESDEARSKVRNLEGGGGGRVSIDDGFSDEGFSSGVGGGGGGAERRKVDWGERTGSGSQREKVVEEKKRKLDWEVFVIKDDKTRNAFVLPNGKIFVFTGILPTAQNPDGLAAVLGHEIAHQVARHTAERMSLQKVPFDIIIALSVILESTLGISEPFRSIGVNLLLTLPNSRAAETEADHIGLLLASRACFDPREAVHLWERMYQAERSDTRGRGGGGGGTGAGLDFLSTHPASGKRVEKMKEWMQEAVREMERSECAVTADANQQFSRARSLFG